PALCGPPSAGARSCSTRRRGSGLLSKFSPCPSSACLNAAGGGSNLGRSCRGVRRSEVDATALSVLYLWGLLPPQFLELFLVVGVDFRARFGGRRHVAEAFRPDHRFLERLFERLFAGEGAGHAVDQLPAGFLVGVGGG